ncbi:MAG TPA: coenzyme F420-0:L-glutamate ligase [Candidatus Nitrosotalea sp.]|nr:coenzyme F420-0:L-glutamate ligase [Candidatus Nitrosotalea sp.]
MALSVLPIRSTPKEGMFDLFSSLRSDLGSNGIVPETGDVIVISSKYVANSQGRIVDYGSVLPSSEAEKISSRFQMRAELAEIILRESDAVFGGIPGFVITSSDNIMAPNAGIDKSNAKKGSVILYPIDPYAVAEQLRRSILLSYHVHVGIIIADSRLMPARSGTVGVAIACAGMEPLSDLRGHKDLYGNPLKVTLQAVADDLATIANFKMGEGAEAIPAAIVRDSGARLTDRRIHETEMAISYQQCVYVRGLAAGI